MILVLFQFPTSERSGRIVPKNSKSNGTIRTALEPSTEDTLPSNRLLGDGPYYCLHSLVLMETANANYEFAYMSFGTN
jgi:hypothetical protein